MAESMLKARLREQVPELRDERERVLEEHGTKHTSEHGPTVKQAATGAPGVRMLICDTSEVPPDVGLLVREMHISKLTGVPPEGILWLLATGNKPTDEQLADIRGELASYGSVPMSVWAPVVAMPQGSHPMDLLSTAFLALNADSVQRAARREGVSDNDIWEYYYDDFMRTVAWAPELVAGIYRLCYGDSVLVPRPDTDNWSFAFASMLGLEADLELLASGLQLALTLHCDHESGNASAHTGVLVGSTLATTSQVLAAACCALAGPRHGLAAQQCLQFNRAWIKRADGVPSVAAIGEEAGAILDANGKIAGYGHKVLRVVDPRFTELMAFGAQHPAIADTAEYLMAQRMFEAVPPEFEKRGKGSHKNPNVDAGSGAVYNGIGVERAQFYTVIFMLSRLLGIGAQMLIERILNTGIERPKSMTTKWIVENALKIGATPEPSGATS